MKESIFRSDRKRNTKDGKHSGCVKIRWVDILNKIFQPRINATQESRDIIDIIHSRHIHPVACFLALLYFVFIFSPFLMGINKYKYSGDVLIDIFMGIWSIVFFATTWTAIFGLFHSAALGIACLLDGYKLQSLLWFSFFATIIYAFYMVFYMGMSLTTIFIINNIGISLLIVTIGSEYFYEKTTPHLKDYLKESRREFSNWFKILEHKTHLTESDHIEMEKKIEALKRDEYVKLSDDEAEKLMLAFEMIKEHKLEIYAPIEPTISTVTPISNIEEVGKYAECPYCGSNIRETFNELGGIVRCDKCGAFHHKECFEYYGRKCGSPSCKLREA